MFLRVLNGKSWLIYTTAVVLCLSIAVPLLLMHIIAPWLISVVSQTACFAIIEICFWTMGLGVVIVVICWERQSLRSIGLRRLTMKEGLLSLLLGILLFVLVPTLVIFIERVVGIPTSTMGVVAALAIAIHNFPEGFATFASALKDVKIGIPIAIAIAIHNIPEGIAVSIPIFYATGNRNKAFTYSFLSGLSEPIGALIGYALLFSFFNDIVFGILFASVAGIMVFISLDELLPTAREYGEHHLAVYGLVAGMAVMAISLLMFL